MKTFTKQCRKCSSQFKQPSKSGRLFEYCSECRFTKCIYCGKEFTTENYKFKYKGEFHEHKYCSLSCRSKDRFKNSRINLKCSFCKKQITVPISHMTKTTIKTKHKFCGRTCRTKFFWSKPKYRKKIQDGLKKNARKKTKKQIDQLNAARKLRKFGPAFREKIRQMRMKLKFPTKMTSIEKIMKRELQKLKIPFVMHRPFLGCWQPDFTIIKLKIFIQVDGDYWHSRPGTRKRDYKFNRTAKKHGWKTLRFWEHHIHKKLPWCMDKVIETINQRKIQLQNLASS